MNNYLKFLLFIALSVFIVSCQQEEEVQLEEQSVTQEYPKIAKKLEAMHFNINGLEKVDFVLPGGEVQEMFKVEEDMLFTRVQIEEMKVEGGITTKQYRTRNTVRNGSIDILGYTGGGGFGLSSKERTALQWAVNNYNRLNLGIRFRLTYGTNHSSSSIEMVVYHNPNESGAGGVAGFPSRGKPHKYIQIYGLNSYNTNVVEHVITHEMGHSVGLRHTDWFSRQSCGQSGESANPDGAIHIPGTPTGYDSTSIMLACFGSDEDGEFNGNDITALRYLY